MKRVLRYIAIALAIPILVFLLLCVLIYLPPIQRYAVSKVTEIASRETGMHVQLKHVSLRFPLSLTAEDAIIIDRKDTLLNVRKLTTGIRILPLFRKQVQLDDVELDNGHFNTASLIEGLHLKGRIGRFLLQADAIDLPSQKVRIRKIDLDNSRLSIAYADTAAQDTTPKAPLAWKIRLDQIRLHRVGIDFAMPLDTLHVATNLQQVMLKDGRLDLEKNQYTFRQLLISESDLRYDGNATAPVAKGFDPYHLRLSDIGLQLDSVLYRPDLLRLKITSLQMHEQSGLHILSSKGLFEMTPQAYRIPGFEIRTGDSFLAFSGTVGSDITAPHNNAPLQVRLLAEIGKGDLLRFLPQLPDDFKKAYPAMPLRIHAGIDGRMHNLSLTSLQVSLPQAFQLHADGQFLLPLDSLRRRINLNLKAKTGNLQFIQSFTAGFILPQATTIEAFAGVKGPSITTTCQLNQGKGGAKLLANYHLQTEAYQAKIDVNRLNLNRFLPGDSLYRLTTHWDIKGQGTDLLSSHSTLAVDGQIKEFQYGHSIYNRLILQAKLDRGLLTSQFDMNDDAIDLSSQISCRIRPQAIHADVTTDIYKIDLKALGITDIPLKTSEKVQLSLYTDLKDGHRFTGALSNIRIIAPDHSYKAKDIQLGASTLNHALNAFLQAGDLNLSAGAEGHTEKLSRQLKKLTVALQKQWKDKRFDLDKIRSLLPTAHLYITSGKDNPLANYLLTKNIQFNHLNADLTIHPQKGFNGSAMLSGLHTDSLWLDSIYFNARQNPQRLVLNGGVKAATHRYQEAFEVQLQGEMAAQDAHLDIEYLNGKGEQGAFIGLQAVLEANGIRLHVTPDNPTLVYRMFKTNPDNYIFLRQDGKIEAKLQLQDTNYTGLEFYSTPDSTATQNLTAALHNIDMGEFRRIIPYMPDLRGKINAEIHYILTGKQMQISTDANIDEFAYNEQAMGNWGMSAVYLPKENGEHRIDGFISMNDRTIAKVNGSYFAPLPGKTQGALSSDMSLIRFPLEIANSFVPEQRVIMSGNLSGIMTLVGQPGKFLTNGEVKLDSVRIRIPTASLDMRFDNRPVEVTDSRMQFDQYKIYTTGNNPFTIDGYFDFKNTDRPSMNLRLFANDFELINARKTRESLVYGKIYVDFNSVLKGNLQNLSLRGNMNVLGKSDFTYLFTDSPLGVEDRLGETVTFTNFNDTAFTKKKAAEQLMLGNLNLFMSMHIDEAVQCRVNLIPNGSNYMQLEGGGDLSFQYKGDDQMYLNGRYTLLSGEMKYEMPVIPLKTFHIESGSYVEWMGDIMNPRLQIHASERVRASVSDDGKSSRMVNFDVGLQMTNQLENLGFLFTLNSPDDASIQNELASKTSEERNKLAVTMLVTGMYMSENNVSSKALNASTALNALLQSEINSIAGNAARSIDLNFGMETTNRGEDGSTRTDYNFQFAKRFWNNRIRVVIGGKLSTGNNVQQQDQTFIDNVSIEYRLDNSGTRYIRLFHNKNYESILDGEVIETGVGLVLQRRVSRLQDLFIFRSRKPKPIKRENENP